MTVQLSGLEAASRVKDALAAAGMPCDGDTPGSELTGWTTRYGSTGFSLRARFDGQIQWHLVISGRPHLQYCRHEQETSSAEPFHEPVDPESLFARLRLVFESLALEVTDIRYTGHQYAHGDAISFEITTRYPCWLESALLPVAQCDAMALRFGVGLY